MRIAVNTDKAYNMFITKQEYEQQKIAQRREL